MEGTFHRRELLPPSVAFGSSEGKSLFGKALSEGHMSGYFILSEHYLTQGHPAYCGLGSLTMALNALLIDPQRTWQGVWRWFDESQLDCCEPLDIVRLKGITMDKLACLSRCNGAITNVHYGNEMSIEEFRQHVRLVCSMMDGNGSPIRNTVMLASYGRAVLNQTGTGHFSPIGGYCEEEDMVLILDVARFKYPPHWVPLQLLHEAVNTTDTETGLSRGIIMMSASSNMLQRCHYCCKMECLPCGGTLETEGGTDRVLLSCSDSDSDSDCEAYADPTTATITVNNDKYDGDNNNNNNNETPAELDGGCLSLKTCHSSPAGIAFPSSSMSSCMSPSGKHDDQDMPEPVYPLPPGFVEDATMMAALTTRSRSSTAACDTRSRSTTNAVEPRSRSGTTIDQLRAFLDHNCDHSCPYCTNSVGDSCSSPKITGGV